MKKDKEELEKEEDKDLKEDNKMSLVSKALGTQAKGKLPSKRGTNTTLEHFTKDAIEKADAMVKSGLLPDGVKNAQAALVIMQKGSELGLSPMSAFEHIVVINGKATLDGAAMATLLKKGGVDWEVTKNAEEVYETDINGKIIPYVTGTKDGQKVKVKATQDHIDKGIPTVPKLVDVITEIKFYRRSSVHPDKILEHTARFSYKEAVKAELTDKTSWKYYMPQMLFWRTMALGARQFAPDLLLGMHTPEEIDDTGTVWMDETGKVINLKDS